MYIVCMDRYDFDVPYKSVKRLFKVPSGMGSKPGHYLVIHTHTQIHTHTYVTLKMIRIDLYLNMYTYIYFSAGTWN